MHQHFADMFNAIEMGVRFEQRNRIPETGTNPTPAPKTVKHVTHGHGDNVDLVKPSSKKTTHPKKPNTKHPLNPGAGHTGATKPAGYDAEYIQRQNEHTHLPEPKHSDAETGAKDVKKPQGPIVGTFTSAGEAAQNAVDGAGPFIQRTGELAGKGGDTLTKAGKRISDTASDLGHAFEGNNDDNKVVSDADSKMQMDGKHDVVDVFTSAGAHVQQAVSTAGKVMDAAGKFEGAVAQGVIDAHVAAGQIVSAPVIAAGESVVNGVTASTQAGVDAYLGGLANAGKSLTDEGARDLKSLDDANKNTVKTFDEAGKRNAERWSEVNAADGKEGTVVHGFHTAGAAVETAADYVWGGLQTGTDYVSREVDAQHGSFNAVGDAVTKYAQGHLNAIGSFFGTMFGGSKAAPANETKTDPAKPAAGPSGSGSSTMDDYEYQQRTNKRQTTGSGSSTLDEYKYQLDTAKSQASGSKGGTSNIDALDPKDHIGTTPKSTPEPGTHTKPGKHAKPGSHTKPVEHPKTDNQTTPAGGSNPVDHTTPANRAKVIKAAIAAKLISPNTTFNSKGQAVHTVEKGDGYWNIVAQYSGSKGFDYGVWKEAQRVNHPHQRNGLEPNYKIVIPGRSISDLAARLKLSIDQ